jgi:hypothetical protein
MSASAETVATSCTISHVEPAERAETPSHPDGAAASTTIEKDAEAVEPPAPVAVTTRPEAVSGVVGVPLITPVDVSSVRPVGSVPEVSANDVASDVVGVSV